MAIRTEKTKYNPRKDFNNWNRWIWEEDELRAYSPDPEQDRILEFWSNTKNLNPTERKEAELLRRVSAAAEGDNLETRVKEARNNYIYGQKVAEKLFNRHKSGQSEEQFSEELEDFGNYFRKAKADALKDMKESDK